MQVSQPSFVNFDLSQPSSEKHHKKSNDLSMNAEGDNTKELNDFELTDSDSEREKDIEGTADNTTGDMQPLPLGSNEDETE